MKLLKKIKYSVLGKKISKVSKVPAFRLKNKITRLDEIVFEIKGYTYVHYSDIDIRLKKVGKLEQENLTGNEAYTKIQEFICNREHKFDWGYNELKYTLKKYKEREFINATIFGNLVTYYLQVEGQRSTS
ncbi:hypothetical protein GF374_01510 [Candidatus Woesearchaeota archaeon]|nr:hypothetical protein [Candidatus Woesearchaeota archaeon]